MIRDTLSRSPAKLTKALRAKRKSMLLTPRVIDVGEAEKEGEAKERIPIINANAAVAETNRKVEKANAEQILKAPEIEISREINLEQIAAQRSAEQKDAKSRKVVEQRRAEMELESLRATTVTQAQIARERGQQKADADAFTAIEKADAQQYNQQPGRRCCRRFDGAGSRIGRQPATVAQHHSRTDRYDCAELVDAAAGSARLPAKNERGDVFFGEDGVENGSIGEDEYDQWAQVIYCSFWGARRSDSFPCVIPLDLLSSYRQLELYCHPPSCNFVCFICSPSLAAQQILIDVLTVKLPAHETRSTASLALNQLVAVSD